MILLEILKYIGIDIYDHNVPSLVLLSLNLFLLIIISLSCFLNIIFYFIVINFLNRNEVLEKLKD